MASERSSLTRAAIALAERGSLPDALVRFGIRRLLGRRLDTLHEAAEGREQAYVEEFARSLEAHAVAEETDKANEQHYELPPRFFELCLGPRLKYSSCFYPHADTQLAEAEEAMLNMTCERAELEDGQRILELGCGWGSLTLWMAEKYPRARITAVSNSGPQTEFIRARAEAAGRSNVTVLKRDINDLSPEETFDRVVSVEMFEHVRNYHELLRRIRGWLAPGGKLFIHVFAHRSLPYLFETNGDADWMARYFFSGGTMPSPQLFEAIDGDMAVEQTWWLNGRNYAATLEAWLRNMDAAHEEVGAVMQSTYGDAEAEAWRNRWRMFYMACAELFAYHGGREWGVAHLRFVPQRGNGEGS